MTAADILVEVLVAGIVGFITLPIFGMGIQVLGMIAEAILR